MEFELLDTGIFDGDRYFDIVHRIRQGVARGHLHPDRGDQPRSRPARTALLPQLWFRNTWGWGRRAGAEPPSSSRPARDGHVVARRRRPRRRAAAEPASSTYRPGRARTCRSGAAARRSSPTTKRMRQPSGARRRSQSPYREGRVSSLHRRRAKRRRQPGGRGTQGRPCTIGRTIPPGGSARVWRLRLTPDRRSASRSTMSTPWSRRGAPRPTSSMRRSTRRAPARTRASCSGRRWPACCGPSRSTCSTWQVARRRQPGHAPSARRATTDPQLPLAPPQLDAHPARARQVGVSVVRGLGPGVPVRDDCAGRSRSSPRRISGCCYSSSSSIPTARFPPTSGSSPT